MAAKKESLTKKAELERQKRNELTASVREYPIDAVVEEMKAMIAPDSMVQKVQDKLETDAREKVHEIQGQAYETYD